MKEYVAAYPIEDRAAWLEWRKQDLTCSDLGAALGLDPYKTPLKLYCEKTGLGFSTSADNPAMKRGRWFEAAGVEALRETYPTWDIRRSKLYLRDTMSRLGGTPDCVAENPDEPGLINIQIKSVSRFIFERDWINGPPANYLLQTVGEGYLLDSARSYIAALVFDSFTADLEMFAVPRHAEAEARILEITDEFWENVAAGKRPAPDFVRDEETINALYPAPAGPPLDLSTDNRLPEILAERAALKASIDAEAERLKAIETEIKAKLGDSDTGVLPGWKITWKLQHRKETVVAASSFRRLLIKNLNDEAA